ncbi:MAG: FixH family protein [Nitrospirae bacterium]|nr:FixH family protein [Nitrospirota bacterium]
MNRFLLIVTLLLATGCIRGDKPPLIQEHLIDGVIQKEQQEMSIKVEMSPRLSILGENQVFITLKDPSGIPIEDAHLNISSTSRLPGMLIERVEVNDGPKGVYETKLHYMSVGQWKITLSIHRFGKREIKNIFLFDVIGHA